MANLDQRAQAIDAIHARIVSAEIEIRKAIAECHPLLDGHRERVAKLNEALRLLNNVSACLPWRKSTSTV